MGLSKRKLVKGTCAACKVTDCDDLDELRFLCIMCYTRAEVFNLMANFEVKSGEKLVSGSGMERHKEATKIDYSLALDGPMFERLAIHLSKALKANGGDYDERNWMKAKTPEDAERWRRSAVRHFYQWLRGDTDEDHAAAVFFNINGYEYTKERIEKNQKFDLTEPPHGPC